MRKLLSLFLLPLSLFMLFPSSAHAQSSCAASLTTVQRNPTKVAIPGVNATNPDGSAQVASVTISYSKQATPAVVDTTITIPRASFTLEAGSTDNCWVATITPPTALVAGTTYLSTSKFTNSGGVSGGSSPASNPFFWDGAPPAPASMRLVAWLRMFGKASASAMQRFWPTWLTSKLKGGR